MATPLRHLLVPPELTQQWKPSVGSKQRKPSKPRQVNATASGVFNGDSRSLTSIPARVEALNPYPLSSRQRGSQASRVCTADGATHEEFSMADDIARLPFMERLNRAWRILFPPAKRNSSAAEVAKERLRLVLYTDRGEVSPEVRNRLRQHIISAISSYVEIEDEDEVQLHVAADPSLGAVYSVTIPVRRVKPEFQEYWSDVGFRDRFYEEILKEEGVDSRHVAVQTTLLEPGDH